MFNEWKIRRLLNSDRYSLNCEYDEENKNVIKWSLYKKYQKSTLSDNPIMTSDSCSEKELMSYVKKHRRYNITSLYDRVFYILLIVIWSLILINFKINSSYLDGIIIGIDIALFVLIFSNMILHKKNFKLIKREYEEDMKELLDKLVEDLKKSINSSDDNG